MLGARFTDTVENSIVGSWRVRGEPAIYALLRAYAEFDSVLRLMLALKLASFVYIAQPITEFSLAFVWSL